MVAISGVGRVAVSIGMVSVVGGHTVAVGMVSIVGGHTVAVGMVSTVESGLSISLWLGLSISRPGEEQLVDCL